MMSPSRLSMEAGLEGVISMDLGDVVHDLERVDGFERWRVVAHAHVMQAGDVIGGNPPLLATCGMP